eukprot:1268888-Pleurochrysis_carterae.AAC.2
MMSSGAGKRLRNATQPHVPFFMRFAITRLHAFHDYLLSERSLCSRKRSIKQSATLAQDIRYVTYKFHPITTAHGSQTWPSEVVLIKFSCVHKTKSSTPMDLCSQWHDRAAFSPMSS